MSTATKRPRTAVEAVPQLATLPERVATLEVKVSNIDEKIGDIRTDMFTNHETLLSTLKEMRDTSVAQHTDMANKIKDLEGFKNKWTRWVLIALAFAAGAGWIRQDLAGIIKFLGL